MMTQQKKYIWLRNIALLSISGFLCYSLFPFPPITWRLLFLGVVFFTIWPNLNRLTRLEKWVIAFWGLNLVYFFTSYLWLDRPSTTQIGNISVTLLSIPLFLTLSRRGVMTNKFYSYAIILLLLSAIVYYESLRVILLAKFIHRDNVTNNASVVFVYLLPFVLFLKNRYLSYGVTLICAYFLLEGAKRGNIVCAIPVIILFVILTFRNKQVKYYEKFLFIVFFLFAVTWGIKQFEQNEYLQQRIEQTIEGDSSNRDIVYTKAWNAYSQSESVLNLIWGYGFDGAKNHKQIGGYAHNDWLEILVDYGALGAIFYLSIFILLYQQIRKTKDIQKRYTLIAITSVWFLKTAFSMGFTEEITFILLLSLGSVYQREDSSLQNSK